MFEVRPTIVRSRLCEHAYFVLYQSKVFGISQTTPFLDSSIPMLHQNTTHDLFLSPKYPLISRECISRYHHETHECSRRCSSLLICCHSQKYCASSNISFVGQVRCSPKFKHPRHGTPRPAHGRRSRLSKIKENESSGQAFISW